MLVFDGNKFNQLEPKSFLAKLNGLEFAGMPPFNEQAVAILGSLSQKLIRSPLARVAPQLTVLGFWLRPSRIESIQQNFRKNFSSQSVATSRGIAFHLPPQNVDTLFVYSWALSLLAGNVNVVRLPSTLPDVLTGLLKTVGETLVEFDVVDQQIFCQYDRSTLLTGEVSALADLRIIWGGDSKVLSVSKHPVRPDGLSIGFSDRKSFSVISADAYSKLSDVERDDLAGKLFNDVYWFDQMGCGSPRVLFWVGDAKTVSQDLYTRLDTHAEKKLYTVETGIAINKFMHMNELVASNLAQSGRRFSNRLSVLKSDFHPDLLNKVQGGGLLVEVELAEAVEVAEFVDRRTQTITHFGLDEGTLHDLATAMISKGGYRVVPVGEALSFSEVWDGMDLLSHMTRQITVQA